MHESPVVYLGPLYVLQWAHRKHSFLLLSSSPIHSNYMALKENRRTQAPWKAGTGNSGVTWETKGPPNLGFSVRQGCIDTLIGLRFPLLESL